MNAKAVLERSYPYVIGLASAAVVYRFKLQSELVAQPGVDMRQIASAGLNIFVLLTCLLFSVFVLAIGPGGGFVEKIFNTKTFLVFRRYVIEAMLLGALATFIMVPMMATEVDAKHAVWSTFYVAIAAGVGTAAFGAFYRTARIFLLWVKFASTRKSR